MMNKSWLAVAWVILVSVPARSDTITTTKNLGYNGTLLSMSNGVIMLEAHFPAGIKTMSFRIDSVQSVEFNSTINNGPPPKTVGIGPGKSNSAAEVIPGDIIVLRGNDRRACTLLSIDANRVYCEQRDSKPVSSSWARRSVLRIQVGTK